MKAVISVSFLKMQTGRAVPETCEIGVQGDFVVGYVSMSTFYGGK